ncbi:hypothetical protein [uncultured Jatrophihabitans sp.]|uniref:hypothetical protein n=1 Tax=uncultured Jatrophihabitans sp. TaxID=1610747 RepID=UPI0035CB2706
MNATTQRLCAWCGIAFMVMLLIGVVVAGFLPPPSPGLSANAIANLFAEHRTRIRIGLIVMIFGCALLFPYSVAIAVQLRRVEGEFSPMAWTELLAGGCSTLLFLVPQLILQTATFRDYSPQIVQVLDDLGWIAIVSAVSFALIQNLAIAIAVLRDHRAQPIYPRWVGYLNIWAAIIFCGGTVAVFFKSGPFAWRGLFAWWLPLSVFGLWFLVMVVTTVQAINRQEVEHAAEHGGAAVAAPVESAALTPTVR